MRTSKPVRQLSVEEMQIGIHDAPTSSRQDASQQRDGGSDQELALPEDDPIYQSVKSALADGYAGVIFAGPPGTSKSWYANRVAFTITGSSQRVRCLQFHPSYQYEDFIEGWVSNGSGGFELREKHFLQLCSKASADPIHAYVVVIDEISRCDVSRVFGEALTYLETTLRGKPFLLASGRQAAVPANVYIVATMNPWDLTVDELDFALERRFARIEMQPNVELLQILLTKNGVEAGLRDSIAQFFRVLQQKGNPMLHVGHAYFARVRDRDSLLRLWQFQLKPHIERATRKDPAELQSIESAWKQLIMSA